MAKVLSEIVQALADWNPWWETGAVPPALQGIRRPCTEELIRLAEERQIKIVTGVRRGGKSTLFKSSKNWRFICSPIMPIC